MSEILSVSLHNGDTITYRDGALEAASEGVYYYPNMYENGVFILLPWNMVRQVEGKGRGQ